MISTIYKLSLPELTHTPLSFHKFLLVLVCLFNTNFEGEETVYLTVALSVNNEIMYYKGRLCDQLVHTCVGSQHSVICGKNTAEVMTIQVTLTLLESDCVTS